MGHLNMWFVLFVNPCSVASSSYISAAGGGAYYLAKRSINADKKARHEEDMRRRQLAQSFEFTKTAPQTPKKKKALDNTASPASEASHDPAPTQHAPEHEEQNVIERSKYEASVPYKSKRGDRFS